MFLNDESTKVNQRKTLTFGCMTMKSISQISVQCSTFLSISLNYI